MSSQSKIINNEYLKLSDITKYSVIRWNKIKDNLYYVEAYKTDDRYKNINRYWVSEMLYNSLNEYVGKIYGAYHCIFNNELVMIQEIIISTGIKSNGKIKQDLWLYTRFGSDKIYNNYGDYNSLDIEPFSCLDNEIIRCKYN